MREALFAMLGDARRRACFDLFAGTGALGIEALSRGAEQAVFVERDPGGARSCGPIWTRWASTERRPRCAAPTCWRRCGAHEAREETYDLVFIDPPYRQAHDWGPELSAVLPSLLAPAARVVVESDRRAPLELTVGVDRVRATATP